MVEFWDEDVMGAPWPEEFTPYDDDLPRFFRDALDEMIEEYSEEYTFMMGADIKLVCSALEGRTPRSGGDPGATAYLLFDPCDEGVPQAASWRYGGRGMRM